MREHSSSKPHSPATSRLHTRSSLLSIFTHQWMKCYGTCITSLQFSQQAGPSDIFSHSCLTGRPNHACFWFVQSGFTISPPKECTLYDCKVSVVSKKQKPAHSSNFTASGYWQYLPCPSYTKPPSTHRLPCNSCNPEAHSLQRNDTLLRNCHHLLSSIAKYC